MSIAILLMGGAALAVTVGLATVIGQDGQPVDFSHNVTDAPAPVAGAVFGSGSALHPGDRICTTGFQATANADTGCEKNGPSNETSIAVNPTKVKAWRESGLLYPSIVTGIIRTIEHDMIARKLGAVPASELHAVEDKLRAVLAL